MVKTFLFLLMLLPLFLFSGEFTASVNRNQVNLGESFVLNLTLKDASANAAPSVTHLKNAFIIHSQQQSTNTVIMNGNVSSSNIWKVTLIPQKEGELIIPSISINTAEGTLSTEPIKILVTKGGATSNSDSDLSGMTLTVDVSKAKPYKNEPFFYTVRLTSKADLADLRLQKFAIEDAIVEENGEPKLFTKVVEGMKVNIIDFSYLITPLKTGSLNIPSITLQGSIPTKLKTRNGTAFDSGFDHFFNNLAFDRLQPFALTTEELALDVQAPIAGINPWLPAKSLKIEEVWDNSQKLQVGEPIIRTIQIEAEGVMSSQLPDLQDLQINDVGFKTYVDKPETRNEIKEGNIHSFRKEQFTMIPQNNGPLILPEISIAWWDVVKNEKAVARIPARTLEIMPKMAVANAPIAFADDAMVSKQPQQEIQRDPLLYVLLGGLALLLIGAIVWGISLQKKIVRLTETPTAAKPAAKVIKQPQMIHEDTTYASPKPAKNKKEKLPDLNPT